MEPREQWEGAYRAHAAGLLRMVIDAERRAAADLEEMLRRPDIGGAYHDAVQLFEAEARTSLVEVKPGQRWRNGRGEKSVTDIRHGMVISHDGRTVSADPLLDFVRGHSLLN